LVSRNETVCRNCLQAPQPEGADSGHREPSNLAGEAMENNEQMVTIAKFRNAAEAGYFAHELLRGADIPAVVTMDENFDAISGFWTTRFALAVAEEFSETALLCLQRLSDHSEPDDMPFDSDFAAADEFNDSMADSDWMQRPSEAMASDVAEQSNVNWVPIVLTLAAGSIVFWGVRTMNAKPRAQAAAAGERNQPDVWEMLSTPDRPWVQKLETGRRELRFDSVRREGILYEDLDGDGRFETKIRVREFAPQHK
jgi:hypothetical protein